jgi:hypothetical protein
MESPDSQKEIPAEEREKFSKYLYHYSFGDVIISEGQHDVTLYLLRVGSVGVFKDLHGVPQQVSTIEAVNLFGEIAPIIDSPRTATVRVTSPEAVVYKFPTFDLKAIYTNPTWTEMLISRLCGDVKEANNRSIILQSEFEKSTKRNQELVKLSEVLVSALINLQNKIAYHAVVNSKEWQFLVGLRDMTLAYVKKFMPEVYARTGDHGSDAAVDTLYDKGMLPESLKALLKNQE